MKKNSLFLVSFFLISVVFAQQKQGSPVLFSIDDSVKVTKDDFLRVHKKNASMETEQDYSLPALQNYLDMYINFKLKVIDAKNAGCDTLPDLIEELGIYRHQLAEPYLTDSEAKKDLLAEAYKHYCYDLRASHIVIPLDREATGKDTLVAYKKAMEIRRKALKGEPFEKLVENFSEDFSAKSKLTRSKKSYGGDLGYFSAFGTVYPFEKAAYAMNVGDISMPVRTDFGYHIIKLTDKQTTLGKIKAAHILINFPPNPTQAQKDSVHNQIMQAFKDLKDGMSFQEAVMRYSDDKGNSEVPGLIPEFTANRMTPDFVQALYSLKKGMISAPVLTRYGWHLIYLIDYTGVPDSSAIMAEIEYRYAKDARSRIPLGNFIKTLRKEYRYKEIPGALEQFSKLIPDSLTKGTWVYTPGPAFKKILFTIESKEYTFGEFAEYLEENQKRNIDKSKASMIDLSLSQFSGLQLQQYELERFEIKHPEYADLMQEYRDGVYLFEISSMKVWAKASLDTVGLEKFYEENKDKYRWSKKIEGILFTYDATNLETAKVKKFMQKMYAKKYSFEKIQAQALKQFGEGNFILVEDSFEPGANVMVDRAPWALGLTGELHSGDVLKSFMIVQNLVPSTYKQFDEIRGLVVADYQNYLEKEWVKELRAKHKITIDQNVLKSMVR